MGQSQNESIESKADESELEKVQLPCNGAFALGPPFVQPNAGEWFDNTPALRMPTRNELIAAGKKTKSKLQEVIESARMRENEDPKPDPQDPNFRFLQDLQFNLPGGASPNPKTPKILPRGEDPQRRELQELIYLARLRDDPAEVARLPRNSSDPEPDGIQGLRLPLSMFLQVRPQPPGARLNTARDSTPFPLLRLGANSPVISRSRLRVCRSARPWTTSCKRPRYLLPIVYLHSRSRDGDCRRPPRGLVVQVERRSHEVPQASGRMLR